jgi:FKBP-type peptidyl-prolyl cis-trans isomerase
MLGVLMGCVESTSAPEQAVKLQPTDYEFAEFLQVALDSMTLSSSGLYYRTLEEGQGEDIVEVGDTVGVDFIGWLPNGVEFDNTDGSLPFPHTLGSGLVISGFDEGLLGMKLSETRQLVIPYQLAYGSQGWIVNTVPVPAYATLVFLVNVVSLHKATP